jgi:biotin carboxyl carrier protein
MTHEVLVHGKPHHVEVLERNENNFLLRVNNKHVRIRLANSSHGKTAIEINGHSLQAEVKRVHGNVFQVRIGGKLFEVECAPKVIKDLTFKPEPFAAFSKRPAVSLTVTKGAVTAPIAGKIIVFRVSVGQRVEKGECICILEAMKMENEVAAPKTGVVKEIRVSEGAVVDKEDVLAIID